MSDTIVVAILVAIPPTLAALATLVTSLKNQKKLADVERSTNGLVAQLVDAERRAAKAEGVQSEREARRGRELGGGNHSPPG